MKARLKRRSTRKNKLIRLGVILIIIVISFLLTFKVLYNSIEFYMDNDTYLDYLVNDSFSTYDIGDLTRLSSTEFLLKYSFGIDKFNTGTQVDITTPVVKTEEKVNLGDEPIVYIFNTHQTEGYKSNFLESFNINNTVFLGSYILKEYLEDLGIKTLVEENSIVDVLNTNGWKYGSSYKASRILLEQAYKEHPSLKFFVDLHRDAASYERTMVEIDGVKYARLMFVIGKEHDNYEVNLALAKKLNDHLKEIKPGLSRGVLEKEGKGVNGIYNQDFNQNTILIEVGGQYNYIEEVNNTLKVMASVIFDYLKGEI